MKPLVLVALCIACLLGIPALAGTYVVGNPPDANTGNCFPWGCSYNAEYQQVYGSSDFSGPLTITNLEFYNTQFNSFSTSLPTGNYTIKFFVTPVIGVNTITGDFALNEAGSVQSATVFSGSIAQSWTFGDTLHIPISPFAYNPAMGNLLIDVVGTNVNAGSQTFFDVNSTGGFFSRVYCPSGIDCGNNGTVQDGYGLVTGFSFGSSVPEPASLLLLGSSLVGLGGLARKRMKKA